MKFLVIAIFVILDLTVAKEWFDNGVFYQIYPKSFKDSDNDGVGDIKGITSRLEHLRDLGVSGAWLSPIFKSPQVDGGYDIQDFYSVDELFGTNDDLKELFEAAKFVGLKIILDFVPNHSSNLSQWFVESSKENCNSKYCDYYVWKDAKFNSTGARMPPNNWVSVFGGPAWTWSENRQKYYLHQFTKEQPDLNFANNDVKKELTDILVYWMDQGVDGFRIDAINHGVEHKSFADEQCIVPNCDMSIYANLNHNITMDQPESYELVYAWRKVLDDYAKENKTDTKFLMTEAYSSIDNQVKWYGSSDGKVLGAHMPFNFALIAELNKESNSSDFQQAVQLWLDKMPSYAQANWVLGNHDRSRFGSRYGEERHESLVVMTMTLPGLNVIYNGEEILMVDNNEISWEQTQDPQACNTNRDVYKEFSRDPVRSPFQWDNSTNAGFSRSASGTWLPIHENYKERNLQQQKSDPKSTYNLYKRLIQLRKSNKVLQEGDYEGIALGEFVFAYARHHENNTIVVAINLGDKEQTVDLTKLKDVEGHGHVLVVTNKSPLAVDSHVDLKEFKVAGYDTVVMRTESGSIRVTVSSLILIFVSFILSTIR